jgi:flagellar basal-body rod protein FlgF
MDRMLYIAMNGAQQAMVAQASNSNNLANATTTGFRADLAQFRSQPVFGPGYPTRAYAMTEHGGINFNPGPINQTGRELDVAVKGDGWITVQNRNGGEGYTRAGDLRVNPGGLLTTGAGHPVLGADGAPIVLPPYDKLEIGNDGMITILPAGQPVNALAEVAQIKLVNPDLAELRKGEDGLLGTVDGEILPPSAEVSLINGALEGSNVSIVQSLVEMIEYSRHYELQVKMMKTAEENDTASGSLLKMS